MGTNSISARWQKSHQYLNQSTKPFRNEIRFSVWVWREPSTPVWKKATKCIRGCNTSLTAPEQAVDTCTWTSSSAEAKGTWFSENTVLNTLLGARNTNVWKAMERHNSNSFLNQIGDMWTSIQKMNQPRNFTMLQPVLVMVFPLSLLESHFKATNRESNVPPYPLLAT